MLWTWNKYYCCFWCHLNECFHWIERNCQATRWTYKKIIKINQCQRVSLLILSKNVWTWAQVSFFFAVIAQNVFNWINYFSLLLSYLFMVCIYYSLVNVFPLDCMFFSALWLFFVRLTKKWLKCRREMNKK